MRVRVVSVLRRWFGRVVICFFGYDLEGGGEVMGRGF